MPTSVEETDIVERKRSDQSWKETIFKGKESTEEKRNPESKDRQERK